MKTWVDFHETHCFKYTITNHPERMILERITRSLSNLFLKKSFPKNTHNMKQWPSRKDRPLLRDFWVINQLASPQPQLSITACYQQVMSPRFSLFSSIQSASSHPSDARSMYIAVPDQTSPCSQLDCHPYRYEHLPSVSS